MDKEISKVIHNVLGLPNLERTGDDTDYLEFPLWKVKEALEAAYLAGLNQKEK